MDLIQPFRESFSQAYLHYLNQQTSYRRYYSLLLTGLLVNIVNLQLDVQHFLAIFTILIEFNNKYIHNHQQLQTAFSIDYLCRKIINKRNIDFLNYYLYCFSLVWNSKQVDQCITQFNLFFNISVVLYYTKTNKDKAQLIDDIIRQNLIYIYYMKQDNWVIEMVLLKQKKSSQLFDYQQTNLLKHASPFKVGYKIFIDQIKNQLTFCKKPSKKLVQIGILKKQAQLLKFQFQRQFNQQSYISLRNFENFKGKLSKLFKGMEFKIGKTLFTIQKINPSPNEVYIYKQMIQCCKYCLLFQQSSENILINPCNCIQPVHIDCINDQLMNFLKNFTKSTLKMQQFKCRICKKIINLEQKGIFSFKDNSIILKNQFTGAIYISWIRQNQAIIIGRKNSHIIVEDLYIDNQHLQIIRHQNEYFIRDLKSKYGTLLKKNDKLILNQRINIQYKDYLIVINPII